MMQTQIKILGAVYIGFSIASGFLALMLLFYSVAVAAPLLILVIWFWKTGTGLWRLNPGVWLLGLITGGVLMLMLHSMLLFGEGGKFAASTGQKIFHLACIAIGLYTVTVLLLPGGQAIFHPALPGSPAANPGSPETTGGKNSGEIRRRAGRQIVFEERLSTKNKMYLAGIVAFIIALAGVMLWGDGRTGIMIFSVVVSMVLILVGVIAYAGFSKTRIICDEAGFQVSESGGQHRRNLVIQRGCGVLFVVSLAVLIIVMNFFTPPGPPSTLNLITIISSCAGIILGITGFFLGRELTLTAKAATGKRWFEWRQVTDMQVFPVGEGDSFVFTVWADGEEALNFASGAQGFRNLLRVFNENAAHLPFLWVDRDTVNRRQSLDNAGEVYFKVLRQEKQNQMKV